MTQPRSALISLADTPWYHVVSRCVRRAFLCGEDRLTGKNFEHRRGWLETWVLQLANLFAIDVAGYALMSNHYHLVVRIDVARAAGWGLEEVLARWTALFTGPVLVQRYLSSAREQMTESEIVKVRELGEGYRERLTNLSWFMRILNENIAREANREDGVKGRFWEGRFKSQALLDEAALLSAMAYVDLNPIRAGLALTPEQSDHTSIKARISALTVEAAAVHDTPPEVEGSLVPLVTEAPESSGDAMAAAAFPSGTDSQEVPPALLHKTEVLAGLPPARLMPFDAEGQFEQAIPFAFADYLELVDHIGRAIHPSKRGAIPEQTPRILDRLGIDTPTFIAHASRFLKEFGHAVGRPDRLNALAAKRNSRSLRGMAAARALFAAGNGVRSQENRGQSKLS